MVSVRRLYIYIVCAVSLLAATAAVIALLQGLIPPGVTPPVTTTALQIAIILISVPFFVLHWVWVQRLAGREPEERTNGVRGLYLFGMLATFLGAVVFHAYTLVTALLQIVLRVQPPRTAYGMTEPPPLETMSSASLALVVLVTLWLYHELTIRQDSKAAAENEMWAGLRRIYIYLFAAVGLTLTCIGANQLLRWLLYQFGGAPLPASQLVLENLVIELARVAIGVPLWLGMWLWAQRRFARDESGERASFVRKLYLYGIVFVAALGAVAAATVTLSGVLQAALGIKPDGDLRETLCVIIVFVAVWMYHTFALRQDAASMKQEPRQATVRRLYLYLVAAIGLGAFLIGLSGVLSVFIRAATGEFFGEGLKVQLAWFTAALIAGLPVWLIPWRSAQIAATAPAPQGTAERRSFVRKLYLYGFVFVATMTVLGCAIYILFQILNLMLGGRSGGNLLADLGQPLAFALIAVGVWLYHGWLLRRDGQLLSSEKADRRAEFRVAIVDADTGQFGRAVMETLRRELPGLALIPVGLTPVAGEAMGAVTDELPLSAQLNQAALIVGPWNMEVSGGASSGVNGETTAALQASPARKLLVPTRREGLDWVGVDTWDATAMANQTARAVKQIIEGEELKPSRSMSMGVTLVLALVGLCILVQVISFLVQFVMRGF